MKRMALSGTSEETQTVLRSAMVITGVVVSLRYSPAAMLMSSTLPEITARAVSVLEHFEVMTRDGLRLAPETIAAMGRTEGKKSRWRAIALWIIAATFIGILIAVLRLA